MRNIQAIAAEVREDTGLIGPVDAKLLARCVGMRLCPMAYPCDGLVEDQDVAHAAYHAMAGETCAQWQIARAVCTYLLICAGDEFPLEEQVRALATLLCGSPALAA